MSNIGLILPVAFFTGLVCGVVVGGFWGIGVQEQLVVQQCKDYGKSRIGSFIIKCEIVQGEETVEGSK